MGNNHVSWSILLLSGVGGFLAMIWGSEYVIYLLLILLMVLDIMAYVIAKVVNQQLELSQLSRYWAQKLMILIFVAAILLVEQVPGFSMPVPLSDALVGFYIVYQALSIMRYAIEMGIPIPQAVQKRLGMLAQDERNSSNRMKERQNDKQQHD